MCIGHVKWCDSDPCGQALGGICLYSDWGAAYICECRPGYNKVLDATGNFDMCQGFNKIKMMNGIVLQFNLDNILV